MGRNVKNEKKEHTRYAELGNDMRCGIGPCTFAFMQVCSKMSVFTGVYSVSALVTSVLNMYISSQITTIEKQFGLSSSQSGFLLSCNDLGFLMTTLFASYFARKVHIPRMLWAAVIIYGIAGFVCALPYFVSKDLAMEQAQHLIDMVSHENVSTGGTSYGVSKASRQSPMCNVLARDFGKDYSLLQNNDTICDKDGAAKSFGVGEPNKYTRIAIAFIAIGMILQGVAKAPRYPFLTAYVDDNVKKKNTAMYIGIISGLGIFGPAIAFSIGGVFSKQYVTLQEVPINPRHPAWIGAWWLGFVVFGLVSMVIGLPLLCFPKRMRPPQKTLRPNKFGSDTGNIAKETAFGFVKSMFRLLSNGVFVLMMISACFTLFAVAGMVSFSIKYLETQFFLPVWKASMYMGGTAAVCASFGTILGGCFITKRKLSPVACLKMLIIVNIVSAAMLALAYWFGCPNADISGYNMPSPLSADNKTCGEQCGCDSTTYFPVCGSDNVNYMSPCHAGCKKQEGMLFTDCSCINGTGKATPGLCDTDCSMFYPYIIAMIISSFVGTMCMMPSFIVTIRSVSEFDKPMAAGFSSFMSTIFGWFLGPVVFGMIIDTACSIWNSSCGQRGSCALYDNDEFRNKVITLQMVPKVLALVCQGVCLILARKKTDWTLDKEDSPEDDLDVEVAMLNGNVPDMGKYPEIIEPDPILKGKKAVIN